MDPVRDQKSKNRKESGRADGRTSKSKVDKNTSWGIHADGLLFFLQG